MASSIYMQNQGPKMNQKEAKELFCCMQLGQKMLDLCALLFKSVFGFSCYHQLQDNIQLTKLQTFADPAYVLLQLLWSTHKQITPSR